MKTKGRYGDKSIVVMEWLNKHPEATNREIANAAKCNVNYVYALRKKMAHVPPCPEGTKEAKSGVDAILDERGSRYGSFTGHAEVTQGYKFLTKSYLDNRNKELAADQQEALDMIFHKIGRIINGDANYDDSWVDIAGYAQLVADRLQGKER